jgi:hypothetical protein
MLVVVALSTFVLGVVVTLMHGLRQWDRRFRGHEVECDRLIALAEVLRTDIRRGTDVQAPAERQLVVASAGGARTRYDFGPQGCTRAVESTDAAGRRMELYAIGPAARLAVERDASGRRPLVMVTLDRVDPQDHGPRRAPLIVYGALGADLATTLASE